MRGLRDVGGEGLESAGVHDRRHGLLRHGRVTHGSIRYVVLCSGTWPATLI